MCVVRNTQGFNRNFIVTNILLSMQGRFTVEEAYSAVQEQKLDVSKNMLINIIKRLRENDYLEETESSYSVIPREKSIRWGGY